MRCTGPLYAPWLLAVSVLALCGLVSGVLLNRTIDDVHGDSVTGSLVQYLPEVPASEGPLWFNQTSCAGCADVPDAQFAIENTWTAALYLADIGSMSVTAKFSGTAIYVFFIIPNFAAGSGLASVVRCQFFIDGVAVGSFNHASDGSGQFTYNALVYQNTTIPNGDHVLLIETTGVDPAIIIFDYVVYTVGDKVDPPNQPPPSPPPPTSLSTASSSTSTMAAQTEMVVHNTDFTTSSDTAAPPSTKTQSIPAFPTAPAPGSPSQSATFLSSALPFLITPPSSDTPPIPSFVNPAPLPDTAASQRASNVVAIVGSVAGGVILVVLALVSLLLYRRRRRLLYAHHGTVTGTVSVFDLLDDNTSPPPPPPSPPQPQMSMPLQSRRALPIPPTGGRSIDATPSKTDFGARGHSARSSVSEYSDARSDLHIHIPLASFRNASALSSHSHSGSGSHGHSPITRNGVPIPPEQEELVRALLLAAQNRDAGSANLTPTTSTSTPVPDEELNSNLWGPPLVHVDSGIRISRAMMDLPPVYAAS